MSYPYNYQYQWQETPRRAPESPPPMCPPDSPTSSPPQSRSSSPPTLYPRSMDNAMYPSRYPKQLFEPSTPPLYSKGMYNQKNIMKLSANFETSGSAFSTPVKAQLQSKSCDYLVVNKNSKNHWGVASIVATILYSVLLLVMGAGVGFVRMSKEMEIVQYEWMEKFQNAQEFQGQLYSKLSDLKTEYEKVFQRELGTNETLLAKEHEANELWGHVDHLQDYTDSLHSSIQRSSRLRVLEKYGAGPHRVEIQLSFQGDTVSEGTFPEDRVVIELAPVDLMPHTVYWFLEQVDRALWDGTSFHTNADHVVQAGPVGNHSSPETSVSYLGKFRKVGLDKLLFREYSTEFQHDRYTVGFAGHPGGPDFYITKVDNVGLHHNPEKPEDMDPCFARVIDGFLAVERLNRATVVSDDFRMRQFIGIQHMRLLPS